MSGVLTAGSAVGAETALNGLFHREELRIETDAHVNRLGRFSGLF